MAEIRNLDDDECRALLGEHSLGRVAFISDDRPVILPVNYIVDDNLVVFRTDPGQKLSAVPMRHVAFEIDSGAGPDAWSVLVQGLAREVTTALGERYDALRAAAFPVQAPGAKEHWIAIEIAALSGRRITS
jgi:nitroimidazol reductase NimA-like FMN-containing flavoprotein (pyridoxamine 5'-phosphate oxidase superfamily)